MNADRGVITLQDKLRSCASGIVLYGLTPPRAQTSSERVAEIAATQIERIRGLGVDGVVLYDLQDETDRTDQPRPFPFMATVDPGDYARDALRALALPKIIYRCVGKYAPAQFTALLRDAPSDLTVLVGAASRRQQVALTMSDAHALRRSVRPDLQVGGVAIPERHLQSRDEHLRVLAKVEQGCGFFITQCVYNVDAAKSFLSDYYHECQRRQLAMVPMLFTITPCGSRKTLEMMRWLGISVPRWLENDLAHAVDILDSSVRACRDIFADLRDYAARKAIPSASTSRAWRSARTRSPPRSSSYAIYRRPFAPEAAYITSSPGRPSVPARQPHRYSATPDVAGPQRIATLPVLLPHALGLRERVHREGPRIREPARVAGAPVQREERVAVAGRPVTQASALAQRPRRPDEIPGLDQQRLHPRRVRARERGERGDDAGRPVAPLDQQRRQGPRPPAANWRAHPPPPRSRPASPRSVPSSASRCPGGSSEAPRSKV
jgi:hypothetical protein